MVRKHRQDPAHVLSIILAGGAGKRLFPLTKYRSKPAVPLGGKYRLIDIPISNCINSGLKRIFVLTQFNSASINPGGGPTLPDELPKAAGEPLASQRRRERVRHSTK